MEPAEYWMWAKRKQGYLSSHSHHRDFQSLNSNYDDSWEEHAFAVDAAGSLGGCIWPPRSYSCSFCKREFRSAQALGGHMNVHRRDRARLKQSPNSQINDQPLHHHHHHHLDQNQSSFSSLGFQYPSKVCDSSLIHNPNPSSNNQHAFTASPPSSSRVSAATASQQILNCQEKTLFVPFSSSIVEGNCKKTSSSPNSSPKSWSNFVTERYHRISDLKDEGKEKSRNLDQEYRNIKEDQVKTDLAVSLNLVFRETHSVLCDGKQEAQTNCKRRKTEASLLPLFLRPSSINRHHHHQLEEDQHRSPSSIEDLDLELRLGDPPKVK